MPPGERAAQWEKAMALSCVFRRGIYLGALRPANAARSAAAAFRGWAAQREHGY